jgi:hypothetical protein
MVCFSFSRVLLRHFLPKLFADNIGVCLRLLTGLSDVLASFLTSFFHLPLESLIGRVLINFRLMKKIILNGIYVEMIVWIPVFT